MVLSNEEPAILVAEAPYLLTISHLDPLYVSVEVSVHLWRMLDKLVFQDFHKVEMQRRNWVALPNVRTTWS